MGRGRRRRSLAAGGTAAVLAAAGFATVVPAAPAMAATSGCTGPSGSGNVTCTFADPGQNQVFTVPANIAELNVTAIGGPGGGSAGASGGTGAKVTAVMPVTVGQKLYIDVPSAAVAGGGGGAANIKNTSTTTGNNYSYYHATYDQNGYPSAPAAGAVDPRVIVAGGGGGAGTGSAGPGAGGNAGINSLATPPQSTYGVAGTYGDGTYGNGAGGNNGADLNEGCTPYGGGGGPLVQRPTGDGTANGSPGIPGRGGAGSTCSSLSGGSGGDGWVGGDGGRSGVIDGGGGGGGGSSYALGSAAKNVSITTDTAREAPQVVISYTYKPYSVTRNADGTWGDWTAAPLTGLPQNGMPTQVSATGMDDGSTQYVAKGTDGNFYLALHNSDGTWSGWNALPGVGGSPNFGGPASAITNIGSGNSVVTAVGLDGKVWYNERYGPNSSPHNNGDWSGWTSLSLPNGATATKVATSMDGLSRFYIMATGTTTAGGVTTTSTYFSSNLGAFSQLAGLPTNSPTGDIALAGTRTTNGNGTQMAVIDSMGQIWHQMLKPDGTYTGWAKPAQPTGGATHLAAVGMTNGDAQFIATSSNGTVYHNIRYGPNSSPHSDGSWSGWGAPAGLNHTGTFKAGQVAIADTGNNTTQTIATATN